MSEYATPMMKQYHSIKKDYVDCLLFFRMGDFYELFMEDAFVGSRILNITLTGKAGGKDGRIPMAGVPYHAADTYIAKLVRAGHKVAICEQLSPPNKKGLVKRGVVRIVTPGTVLDEQNLERKEHNYILSLTLTDDMYALAISDISTGYFAIMEESDADPMRGLLAIIAAFHPSECILPEKLYNDPYLLEQLTQERSMNIYPVTETPSSIVESLKILKQHFALKTLHGFGIADTSPALIPAATLLQYVTNTQNGTLPHIRTMKQIKEADGLLLDRSSMVNLELFATIRDHDTKGSLLNVLDQTITSMGGRMLKTWMKLPLAKKESIERRLNAVESLSEQAEQRDVLREQLKLIPDIERLLARLSVNLGNARDLIQLRNALREIQVCRNILTQFKDPLITEQTDLIDEKLMTLVTYLEEVIIDEPPMSIREGRMIREGVDEKLDALKMSIQSSKTYIEALEKTERQKTSISSLKVKYNKVFGYYIEISKSNIHLVPDTYVRKQTLVNAERYITEELKHHEDIILNALDTINDIEYKLFTECLGKTLMFTESIQLAAMSVSIIDVLASFSVIAEKQHYTKPTLLYSGEIRLKQARHPVVEQLLTDAPFVPNDITLDNTSASLLLITGPNMAGKSVLMRQVALIVLMAQIGSFVPATSAHISVVDKLFVRSGASDFITSGLSTFMVEMVETAHILHNATSNSLIIMDEIGRGTSTYDGISIAWSVAEYFVTTDSPSPKVLFATHYHELQALEEAFPSRIKNMHMAVTEQNGEPIFLHTLLPGGASHSFGISVAKLAGIPDNVIQKAREMLAILEKRSESLQETEQKPKSAYALDTNQLIMHLIHKEILNRDIATMTPLEALNMLAELKEKLKQSNATSPLSKD